MFGYVLSSVSISKQMFDECLYGNGLSRGRAWDSKFLNVKPVWAGKVGLNWYSNDWIQIYFESSQWIEVYFV